MKQLWIKAASVALITLSQLPLIGQKLISDQMAVEFFSDAPLEDISARSTEGKGMLDLSSGAFFFRVPITSFHFENELMEEHFNENYMESEQYPLATFKGNIDTSTWSETSVDTQVEGVLNIHGTEQASTLPLHIIKTSEEFEIVSKFDVALEDYQIEVPTLLFQKIADTISVSVSVHLVPFIKN
ncbi:YceI family protein [Marinoscillum sp.]|uniref:YceI family protein n=1 Tax=Marinoscillum sp. TaxID=2024838 RepID=UPI003BA950FE